MDLENLLLSVQRPGRYIGGEWNAVTKEWTDDKVKVLLAFPDVYEVGMSYLGTKILYGILNAREDCLCERAFSPWPDFEEALRKNNIRLFSLESRHPINQFDIIGFTLAYELGYTNVLNILDLGSVPKRSSERGDGDPIIIAGGPSCYNPEPMAEFIDAFVIGDGEEVAGEIIEAYKGSRVKGQGSRGKILRKLAGTKGIYVPSFYKVEYNEDRTIKNFLPTEKDIPLKIEKRVVSDLDSAFYPTKQIVPNIQIVHDRIALEIMRGCKHACRFCQATATYRPCRQRSREKVLELAREAYAMTGYDEISLLSLSSGDYSHIRDVIEDLNREFSQKAVSISVPSLRIEDVLKDLPILISKVKKSGLTFAPEAGSQDLRKILNKNIDIEKLFKAASEAFKKGWRRVKLYFMIGLPAEKEEDILNIVDLIYKISDVKKEIDGKPAYITASINAFVPKPHTAFQWEPMDAIATLEQKRHSLKRTVRSKMIELDFHPFSMAYLEAVFSRGDRRLSEVIYESWMSAARFDGWQDIFNFDIWLKSFEKTGIDPAFYASRLRDFEENLPWDFIDTGIDERSLANEARALRAALFDKK